MCRRFQWSCFFFPAASPCLNPRDLRCNSSSTPGCLLALRHWGRNRQEKQTGCLLSETHAGKNRGTQYPIAASCWHQEGGLRRREEWFLSDFYLPTWEECLRSVCACARVWVPNLDILEEKKVHLRFFLNKDRPETITSKKRSISRLSRVLEIRRERGQLIRYKQLLRIPHYFQFLLPERRSKKDEKDAFPTGLYHQKIKTQNKKKATPHLPQLNQPKMESNRYPLIFSFTAWKIIIQSTLKFRSRKIQIKKNIIKKSPHSLTRLELFGVYQKRHCYVYWWPHHTHTQSAGCART